MSFMILLNTAKKTFSQFASADKIRFGEKEYSVYKAGNISLTSVRYDDELKEAFRVNGNKNFTLTRVQVMNCFWEVK